MVWRRVSMALSIVFAGSVLIRAQAPPPQAGTAPPQRPASAAPQAAPAAATDALPVRRVVLYKSGVGYFEHLGRVRNRQDVSVRFTSAQLNDVLKSLTTIDLGGGQVTGISYNSIAPIEQRLGALRLPLAPGSTTFDLLASLRGAALEVTGPAGAVEGRLVSVERQSRTKGDESSPVDILSIVTASGELRSFELTPALRVRILDRDLRQEVGRYLDVVGSSREQDVRQMVISTNGSGDRQLFVSYISEVPIWKTTYRLVLRGGEAKPLLQGWAIVDNTIGEDWTNVELSLVAGAPVSFIQNISQPYYGRRPTVPLPQAALLTPQTHEATLRGETAAGAVAEFVSDVSARKAPSMTVDNESRPPRGVIGGVVGGIPGSPPPPPPAPAAPAAYEQMASQSAAATAAALGDLFEYRIKEPITLQKNQSALVPILNTSVTAEKVGIWNRGAGSGRPLRAVWITNASGLTLDGGSIAVIDQNAFAGEGLIEPLEPGERRLLSYAADLGVLVDGKVLSPPARVVRISARNGVAIQETEERSSFTYTARSEESQPVTLIVEHRRRPGWKLEEGQTPAEETPEAYRFRVTVEPRKEATLVVREVRAGQTRIALGDFTDTFLAQLAAQGAVTDAFRKAIEPIVAKRSEVAALDRQLAGLEKQLQAIVEDQTRLRENMKALRGSAEERQLLQRYTRQLDEQENRLEALHKEIAETTAKRDAAREEMNGLIAKLTV